MNAMWGMGLMSLAKVLVIVDKDVNVRDPDEAWWVTLNHIDPERDVRFSMGPIDVLDHASRAFTYGSKMGIDATRKWKEEGFDREWPEVIEMDDETKARVDAMWDKLGITLNTLCLILSPVALVWILTYSFTKRFTSWSHLWLGASLAIAPVGGYLAVTGRWSEPPWTLVVVAVGVLTWVAGFDIFYALQDEKFDRGHGLKSAVVALGEQWSILAAKVLHGITILMLVAFALGTPFGTWYYVGVVVAAAILAWEHHLVRPGDLSRLDAAFFQMNGIMSVVVFVFALGDRLL
jgi:hypothetical protein